MCTRKRADRQTDKQTTASPAGHSGHRLIGDELHRAAEDLLGQHLHGCGRIDAQGRRQGKPKDCLFAHLPPRRQQNDARHPPSKPEFPGTEGTEPDATTRLTKAGQQKGKTDRPVTRQTEGLSPCSPPPCRHQNDERPTATPSKLHNGMMTRRFSRISHIMKLPDVTRKSTTQAWNEATD